MRLTRAMCIVGGLAAGLFVFGHHLTYLAVFRDPAERRHVLSHTGHGWLDFVAPASLLAVSAMLLAMVASAWSGQKSNRHAWRTLVAWQLSAYVVVEAVERVAHGHSWSELAHELLHEKGWQVIAVGLLLQLLVVAVALRVAKLIDVVVSRLRSRRSANIMRSDKLLAYPPQLRVYAWWTPVRGRGPPVVTSGL